VTICDPLVGLHCLSSVVHVEEKGGIDGLSAHRDGEALEVRILVNLVVRNPAK